MKRHLFPALLIACTLIVALWLVMARQSGQPFAPFDLTAKDFAGFEPALPGWSVRSIVVSTNDPAEPNIAAFAVTSGEREDGKDSPLGTAAPTLRTQNPEPLTIRLLARLVHGYNMPMCMKIKGYTVEKWGNLKPETGNLSQKDSSSSVPCQVWRVTSSAGETSIWATTMIRAGDFAPTRADICSMAFPRVDVADDPRWIPRGFRWADLLHPVAGLRQWARARWNASRTDLLTFLRLRQPAWASEELLTYVTRSVSPEIEADNEADMLREEVAVHTRMLEVLREWRTAQH